MAVGMLMQMQGADAGFYDMQPQFIPVHYQDQA